MGRSALRDLRMCDGANTRGLAIALHHTSARPASVEGSITAGRIVFSAPAASSCLAGIVAPDCATLFTTGPTEPTTCREALLGTVADGELCDVSLDCLNDDSICDLQTTVCTATGGDDGND
ncbi:MAG: hypothetical protein H0T79_01620 [Deltaproteobacteria bacterium]|nr:hypothetical protein [Deltaproteobacteria bacterium]